MDTVESSLDTFIKKNHIELLSHGGILRLNHENINNGAKGDFRELSQARYAVRDFGESPVDIEKIKKALTLCERTPSACNRQSWRIHIYTDNELKNHIFDLQAGCKGFHDGMQCAVLICCDAKNYFFGEFSLPYVDGGIYAMNLMYALNYYDLATIPLTLGHREKRIKAIRKEMRLPKTEIPVILIGVGTYKKEFKVAESHRMPYTEYVTFNKESNEQDISIRRDRSDGRTSRAPDEQDKE